MEKTLVLLKPDCMQRAVAGEVISRFEKKGLKIVGMKMMRLGDAVVREHYAHLADKPFFPKLAEYVKSAPIIAMAIEGIDAVEVVRQMCGVTNSRKALPGTIRGDLSMSFSTNIVHASDSKETAEKEVKRFFAKNELFEWQRTLEASYYSEEENK